MIASRNFIAVLGAAALLTGAAFAQEKSLHETSEHAVQPSQVPEAARIAAEQNLGGQVSEAKVMERNGRQVYELQIRTASGQEKSVYVSANGEIIAQGDEDEEDND